MLIFPGKALVRMTCAEAANLRKPAVLRSLSLSCLRFALQKLVFKFLHRLTHANVKGTKQDMTFQKPCCES